MKDEVDNEAGKEENNEEGPFFKEPEDHMEFEVEQLMGNKEVEGTIEEEVEEQNIVNTEDGVGDMVDEEVEENNEQSQRQDEVELTGGEQQEEIEMEEGREIEQEVDRRGAGVGKKGNSVQNMMKNHIPVKGNPECAPKAGDIIQYLDAEGGWKRVTVMKKMANPEFIRKVLCTGSLREVLDGIEI